MASPSGRVLTRAEVARRLGSSLSTIRRMEGKVLNPFVGARGVHYFTETEIDAVFARMLESRKVDAARSDGLSGAEAFALFRQGAGPVEVVKQFSLSPDVAERLFRQWWRFGETMVLDRAAVAQLEAALGRPTPISDEQALVLAIAEFKRMSASHCVLCHRNHARLCRECARKAAKAALAEETLESSSDPTMKAGELAKQSVQEPLASLAARDVSGDVAAGVFARFDAGDDPRDVVTELAVAPATVDYLWRTWARLRGMVLVSPENAHALAVELHALVAPKTPAELVQLVQRLRAEEQSACSRCGGDVAGYCFTCPSVAAMNAPERGRRRSGRGTR